MGDGISDMTEKILAGAGARAGGRFKSQKWPASIKACRHSTTRTTTRPGAAAAVTLES